MENLALEQIRDGREVEMRMRAHGQRGDIGGKHVIEEHERTDETTADRRQHAPDLETTEVARSRVDPAFDIGHPTLAVRVISPIRPD